MGNPSITVGNFDYGPAEQVLWDGSDLGGIMGNITVRFGYEVLDRMAHQYGIAPMSGRQTGHTIEVDIVLEEFTPTNFSRAIQGGTLTGTDWTVGDLTGDELTYGELVIHPKNAAKQKLTIYRSAPVAAVDVTIGDEVSAIQITFRGYIDTTRTLGDQLYKFGDPDDAVAPTIGGIDWSACLNASTGALLFDASDATSGVQASTLVYGDDDDAEILVIDNSTATTPVLRAGTFTYAATGTIYNCTFTPTTAWATGEDLILVVMTGVRDHSGNRLATPTLDDYTVP